MKKKETKGKPLRNYIILGVLILGTVLLTCYLCFWYRTYQKYEATIPVLRGVVPEITEKELDHFMQESEMSYLYLCMTDNTSCRTFEESFSKVITRRQLKNVVTYVNLTNADLAAFQTHFNDKYGKEFTLNNYPAVYLIQNGKVVTAVQGTKEVPLSISEVERIIDIYGTSEE